ncbi:uncharacterized protein Cipc isoform X1 [Drosophila pseudoobscura]|uniref:Uncharacterized protein Cipc isoform X1 n=1 Tax=Drosophila pseudoobscura pseudoobscura TaxID=46245 RepID=A0A6I8VB92_DROPS|nr:uncharacterized protein LOC4802191 isoform X1 [Drosophila pseudoobscura]
MAPTICSDKKPLRDSRRHRVVATAVISSAATTTSSTSTSPSSLPAAAAARGSSVLSYVAEGSMNSAGRRRLVRLHRRRLPVISGSAAVSSSPRSGTQAEVSRRAAIQTEMQSARGQIESAEHQTAHPLQLQLQQQQHSISESIKTVLQPTMANSSNSFSHRGAPTARHCVLAESMDDDGDSGYEYSQEPTKEQQHSYHPQNSDGLLSIAIKTIKLVQRNKLLQKRLAQLQLETSEFIASVLANPENRQYREKITTTTAPPKAETKVSNMLLRH